MLKINNKSSIIKSIVILFLMMTMLFCFGCTKKEVKEPSDRIVFLGDSITSSYNLIAYFPDYHIINSGVWGDRTDQAHERLESDVIEYNPYKVFILLGINDVGYGRTNEDIADRIGSIILDIQDNCPKAEIYLISVYPMNVSDFETWHPILSGDINNIVDDLNVMLNDLADENDVEFIDIAPLLKNENNELKLEYTVDSLHLTDEAYELISNLLINYLE